METKSKHWGDVFKWLESVVDSCETEDQVKSCEILIVNFEKLYCDRIGWLECSKLLRPLNIKLTNVWGQYVIKKVNKNGNKICR